MKIKGQIIEDCKSILRRDPHGSRDVRKENRVPTCISKQTCFSQGLEAISILGPVLISSAYIENLVVMTKFCDFCVIRKARGISGALEL